MSFGFQHRSDALRLTLLAMFRDQRRLDSAPTHVTQLTGARGTGSGCANVTQAVTQRLRFHRVIHEPSPDPLEKAVVRIPRRAGGHHVRRVHDDYPLHVRMARRPAPLPKSQRAAGSGTAAILHVPVPVSFSGPGAGPVTPKAHDWPLAPKN